MTRLVAVLTIAFLVAGCSSERQPEPIGIGRDRDALKRSPCACMEIPQNYEGWART